MPIGTRELLMVLRARDEASRVVSQVRQSMGGLDEASLAAARQQQSLGIALTTVGTAMLGVSAIGGNFLESAISQGMEFDRSLGLVLTQADGIGTSMGELRDVVADVARQIPVPLMELNDALYDIFSSMDVNVSDAQLLLTEFARAAVAGGVAVQDSATITMQILNAYQLPISDVNKVLDVQFELVRTGVGTYGAFAGALGRAVPAAVGAGQSIETLAGMMAFLTRNGLSVEMAATSAARAIELFSNPAKFAAIEALGIPVRNLDGSFRQINDVVTDLANNAGWAKMSEPDRKKMFEDIFGVGTIQARRFFDLAIPNFEQLNDYTTRMQNSSGAMNAAYDIMFAQPTSKVQLLRNAIDLLRLDFWERLRPSVERTAEVFLRLIEVWNGLPESVKTFIVVATVLATVLTGLIGFGLVMAGGYLFLAGIFAAAGIAMGTVALVGAIVIGVIVALVAIGALLAIHWDTIRSVAQSTWGWIRDNVGPIISAIGDIAQDVFGWMVDNVPRAFNAVVDAAQAFGTTLGNVFDAARDIVVRFASSVADGFSRVIDAMQPVVNWVREHVGPVFVDTGEFIAAVWDRVVQTTERCWPRVMEVIEAAISVIEAYVVPQFEMFLRVIQFVHDGILFAIENVWPVVASIIRATIDTIVGIVVPAWEMIRNVTETVWNGIVGFIGNVVPPIASIIGNVWDIIRNTVTTVWESIRTTIESALLILRGVINIITGAISGDWAQIWEGIVQILTGVWDQIVQIVETALDLIRNIWTNGWDILSSIVDIAWALIQAAIETGINVVWQLIQGLWDILTQITQEAWDGMFNVIHETWDLIIAFITQVPGMILDALGDLGSLLLDMGRALFQGLWDGSVAVFELQIAWMRTIPTLLNDLFHGAIDWLMQAGRDVVQGFINGIQEIWATITGWIGDRVREFIDGFKAVFGISSPSTIFMEFGRDVIRGFLLGMQELFLTVLSWLAEIGFKILEVFVGAITWLFNVGVDIIQGLWDGAVWLWDQFVAWTRTIGFMILEAFAGAITWLYNAGVDIIQGLWDGMVSIWDMLLDWVGIFSDLLSNLLSDAINWLFDIGMDVIQGLWNGMQEIWDDVTGWIGNIAGDVKEGFKRMLGINSPSTVMHAIGLDTIQGFLNGMQAVWLMVMVWLRGLGMLMIAGMAGIAQDMLMMGRTIMLALLSGMADGWNYISAWLSFLPGALVRAFDVGPYMRFAGMQIMNGLWMGMEAVFGGLLARARGMAAAITAVFANAFRIASPSKVFFDIGGQLMKGLELGIGDGWKDVEKSITGAVGGVIPAVTPTAGLGSGGSTVSIAPGAFQLVIQGNADSSTIKEAEVMMDNKLRELSAIIQSGIRN